MRGLTARPQCDYDDIDHTLNNAKTLARSSGKTSLWALTYVCIVALQAVIISGFALGFTSPVLSKLKGIRTGSKSLEKTAYQDAFNITVLAGATITAPFGGWLFDYFGRKLSIILCSIPYTIGWLMIILTLTTDGPAFRPLLFTGRFILGIGVGWTSVSGGLYPAEMSPRHLRGAFVVMNQLALTTGTFLGQIIGVYIPYYWLAVIPLAFTLSFIVLSTTIKETPRWLMTQGRKYEAKKVLMWLRGPNYDVEQELQDIQERILSQKKLTLSEIVQEFKNRSVYHPVILACTVMFFRQFSGVFAILFNAEDIFKQADVKSPGLTSSLATGGVQIIASVIGVFVADLFGRRKLLIVSGIMMCLSHATMGTYEYLNGQPYCHPPDDSKCQDHLWPLAIISIACYIANYTAGWGAIARLLLPELIPLRIRGIGIGISFFVSWSSTIFVAGLFDNYEKVVRPWGAFWTLSFICFCSVIFTVLFIPETKGKSLEEIERSFKEQRKILFFRSFV